MTSPKKSIQFFVSYSRKNNDLAGRFLASFREMAMPSRAYRYRLWRDNEKILVGERWAEVIPEALDRCDLGLVLVSPSFLGSEYITENELPRFVGEDAKPVVPAMLQVVDFKRHDLKGLEKNQIFRFDAPRFRHPKAYGDCSSSQRERFMMEFFGAVEDRLDRLYS